MLHIMKLVTDAIMDINRALDINTLNDIRIKYLGKKGYITVQIINLHKFSPEKRSELGAILNKAKKKVQQALNERMTTLKNSKLATKLATETIDVSLPGRRIASGAMHPITSTIIRIENFFKDLGFLTVSGPEIEDDYHNFNALNIPNYHPARTEHDTFWFDTKRLLRTQTSSIQIRIMKTQKPPIRIIASGRVYRNDYDQVHTPMFHQMEGLIIDKDINFTNLKDIVHSFLYNFFEKDLKIRFRPSYFPFTEPSVEVDVINLDNKWIEILGCGMVHPNVLRNVNIDPEIYSGFAFGIGVERLIMLRYDINDLRTLFKNDLRFLKQFK